MEKQFAEKIIFVRKHSARNPILRPKEMKEVDNGGYNVHPFPPPNSIINEIYI